MGGHPEECPERYKLFSPVEHVDSNCPPTLLIQGKHDIMAPVKSTCLLYDQLIKEKVPAVLHLLPQTDHGFDLLWPNIAPSAHNAFYDVERFIALMSIKKEPEENKAALAATSNGASAFAQSTTALHAITKKYLWKIHQLISNY